MNEKICAVCGSVIENDNYKEMTDGKYICNDCFESNNYKTCSDCERVIPMGKEVFVQDIEEYICKDCERDGNYGVCGDCGNVFTLNNLTWLSNEHEYFCEECLDKDFVKCEDCGEIIRREDSYITAHERIICDNCYSDNYFCCDSCGEIFHVDDMYGDYECYCESCYNETRGIISEYHCHDNGIQFFGDSKNNTVPYMGVELEIDDGDYYNSEHAEYVADIMPLNFIYFEEDGSLNRGFENITQPATLEYHTSISEKYKDAFNHYISNKYRSHDTDTCGLHVHFNRSFFEDKEDICTIKLLYLVEKFWDNLVKFSRRDLNKINQWAKKSNKTPEETLKDSKDIYGCDRYQAINLTNSDTIEFRIFRGTLKFNTFIATLQLVDTMVKIAKYTETVEEVQRIQWGDLLKYDEIKTYWEEVKNR